MPTSKGKVRDKGIAVALQGDAVIQHSKIPRFLRFPLVLLLNLTLSALLYSFIADYTMADLARVVEEFRSVVGSCRVGGMEGVSCFATTKYDILTNTAGLSLL